MRQAQVDPFPDEAPETPEPWTKDVRPRFEAVNTFRFGPRDDAVVAWRP